MHIPDRSGYPEYSLPPSEFQRQIAEKLEFCLLDNEEGLYSHQEFVRRFMAPCTPYESVMLNHELGSGKSIACISTAVEHYFHDGKKCLVVTRGQAGSDSFRDQITMFAGMMPRHRALSLKTLHSIFAVTHYISLSNRLQKMPDDAICSTYSDHIIVLDEFHNVRRLGLPLEGITRPRTSETPVPEEAMVEGAVEDGTGETMYVYNCMRRLVSLPNNIRFIVITATPMTDTTEQLKPILDLLWVRHSPKGEPFHGSSVPTNMMAGKISHSSSIQHGPERRRIRSGPQLAYIDMPLIVTEMLGHQHDHYRAEQTRARANDIFHSLSQISLFVSEDGIHGRRIADMMADKVSELVQVNGRNLSCQKYVVKAAYRDHLTGIKLRHSSCKYHELITTLESTKGKSFVFVGDVIGSGVMLLACILEAYGYEPYYGERITSIHRAKRYTICTGDHACVPNIMERLAGFNHKNNSHGDYVRVLIGSKVVGEAITMKCVKYFYAITPHWNMSTVRQAEGRVCRSESHADLESNERYVETRVYVAAMPADIDLRDRSQDMVMNHIETYSGSIDIAKVVRSEQKQSQVIRLENEIKKWSVDSCTGSLTVCDTVSHLFDTGKVAIDTFSLYHANRFVHWLRQPLSQIFAALVLWIPRDDVLVKIRDYFVTNNMHALTDMRLILVLFEHLTRSQESILDGTVCLVRECNGLVYATLNVLAQNHQQDRIQISPSGIFFVPGCGPVYSGPAYHGTKTAQHDHKGYTSIVHDILEGRPLHVREIATSLEYNLDRMLRGLSYDSPLVDLLRVLHVTFHGPSTSSSCHAVLYKVSDVAYTASKVIPHGHAGYLRIWGVDGWRDASVHVNTARAIFESRFGNQRRLLSDRFAVYGFIPLSDGKMRICSSMFVTSNPETAKIGDHRLLRRGKSIKSFGKDYVKMFHIYFRCSATTMQSVVAKAIAFFDTQNAAQAGRPACSVPMASVDSVRLASAIDEPESSTKWLLESMERLDGETLLSLEGKIVKDMISLGAFTVM